MIQLIRGPPVRGPVAAARQPGGVGAGADAASPLGLCEVAAGREGKERRSVSARRRYTDHARASAPGADGRSR